METNKQYLTAVIYGESKVGKTTLAATAPGPILVLDAEAGGMRFVEGDKVLWNPADSAPEPGHDIYQVTVSTLADIRAVYNYLISHEHPFKSIVFDSITEIQGRMVREEMTNGAMQMRDWGTIWIKMEDLIWDFRTVVQHPANDLQTLIIIAGVDNVDGKTQPMLQGRMRKVLPYKVDICGYLGMYPNADGEMVRSILTEGTPTNVAGNRCGGKLNALEWPDFRVLFDKIFNTEEPNTKDNT